MDPVLLLTTLLPLINAGLQLGGINIPANIGGFINLSIPAIEALVKTIISKPTVTDAELAILETTLVTLQNLKTSGINVFSVNSANLVNSLIGATEDAIKAFKASKVSTDPSNVATLPIDLK